MDEPVTVPEKMIPLSEVWPLLKHIEADLHDAEGSRSSVRPLLVSSYDRAARAAGLPTIERSLGRQD